MADYHRPNAKTVQELKDIANKLRIHSIESTQASASGHPTSCASCAEIMSVLFFNVMKYTVKEPRHPANDRFIMSKGHACPILYAAWAETGLFPKGDLLKLRKIDSDLEGHPTPRLNFIDVATGSLGQGLSVAAGMAWVGKNVDKSDYRVFCLLGDGESAEGSVWEALAFASHYKLDNLVAIFDVNRLGQSEPTAYQHQMETYMKKLEAFGWNALVVEGHDVEALAKAFHAATTVSGRPTALIAKTFKGQGFPDIEDKEGFHGKPLGKNAESVIAHIQGQIVNKDDHSLSISSPTNDLAINNLSDLKMSEPPSYKKGDKVATRLAYGVALAKLGKANPCVVAFDADTKNSTFADKFKAACPDRFAECFIAEQNMVGVAVGAACRDRTVAFVSTFAAFLSRAYDQLRMAAVSQTNATFCGSHCGVSIGADGPSQMALEDIAMFRAIPNCTVFYPSDGVSMERAVEMAANKKGMCFIRSSRPNTAVIYDNDEEFVIGKAKIVRQSDNDQLTVVGSGITLYEALKAADLLSAEGINLRVVDPFTIKPMDADTLIHCANATGCKILTVEDHYLEGGIGEAVSSVVSEQGIKVRKVAVNSIPRSGTPDELLAMYKIDAAGIAEAAKAFLKA